MIGGQPNKKTGRKQRAGHNRQGVHTCVANNLAPCCRIPNQGWYAVDSFRPEETNDQFKWLKTFRNKKKKQNDGQSQKCVDMKQWH